MCSHQQCMGITVVSHSSHSGGCVVASRCDFNLHFPDEYDQHFDTGLATVDILCFVISV